MKYLLIFIVIIILIQFIWSFQCNHKLFQSKLIVPVFMSLGNTNNFNQKEYEKQEQLRLQQEILNRRKNKTQMKEYFSLREKQREETQKKAKETLWAQSKNNIDPLTEWKKAKDEGKINPLGYEAEPTKDSSILGFNIILPVNPINIPKYDNGERFDLRLPYAERGYEDPDADVMGKLANAWNSLFGKKKEDKNKN